MRLQVLRTQFADRQSVRGGLKRSPDCETRDDHPVPSIAASTRRRRSCVRMAAGTRQVIEGDTGITQALKLVTPGSPPVDETQFCAYTTRATNVPNSDCAEFSAVRHW
jgi:hypothetical protein